MLSRFRRASTVIVAVSGIIMVSGITEVRVMVSVTAKNSVVVAVAVTVTVDVLCVWLVINFAYVERFQAYLVAGVTVVRKYDMQSAVPCRVVKADA